jgi:hypothetical protein
MASIVVVIVTYGSLLVSLEVKMETYGRSTRSQFNVIFKQKGNLSQVPLVYLSCVIMYEFVT